MSRTQSSACESVARRTVSESQEDHKASAGPRLYTPPPNGVPPAPSLQTMYQVNHHHESLFHRHPKNPILKPADWPYPINTVFNAAATLLPDGATLLLYRVGDYWALIHRPVSTYLGAHIWISFSPDLRHWGSHKMILQARRGAWWDANKIGLSPPPIETPQGWLMLYHGVRRTAAGSLYRLGLALFDLQTPEHCLRRGESWIFGPEEPYERYGDVDNVVFPCGYTIRPDGDTLNLYYGGADTCVALATASIQKLLHWLEVNGKPAVKTLE